MSEVLSFPRPDAMARRGWSQQELAEFYRVEAALVRAGLSIDSEQGLSDEAEPWFVFCRPDGAAIMHFARIGGRYLVASEVLEEPMWGSDFRSLINRVAERHPELLPLRHRGDGTRVTVHPAALLAALVAAAAVSLSSTDARASGWDGTGAGPAPPPPGEAPSAAGATGSAEPEARENHRKQFEAIVFSAMIFAAFAAEEAEGRSEPEAPAASRAHAAAQEGASEAGTPAPTESTAGAGGGGTPLSTTPTGAGVGSGSAAQAGSTGASPRAGVDPAHDTVAQTAPTHADPEPDGRVPGWSGATAPSRAVGSSPAAESEHAARSSGGSGATERVLASAGSAVEATSERGPQERGHPVQDAVSAASPVIGPASLRKAADAVLEVGEGRGAGKGIDAAEGAGAIHAATGRTAHREEPPHAPGPDDRDGDDAPGRPQGQRGDEKGAGRADATHQDVTAATPAFERGGKPADLPASEAARTDLDVAWRSAGDGGRTVDSGAHGGPGTDATAETAPDGHNESAAADAGASNAPGSPGSGPNDPARSAGNDKVDPGERGGPTSSASADAATGGPSVGKGAVPEHATADGLQGKSLDDPGQSAGNGKEKVDPGEHAGPAADTSAGAATAGHGPAKGVGAEHATAASPGNGLDNPGHSAGNGRDKLEPGEQGGPTPHASTDATHAALSAGEAGAPEGPSASDAPGAGLDRTGPSSGNGRDKVDPGIPGGPTPDGAAAGVPAARAQNGAADANHPVAAEDQGRAKPLAAALDAHGNLVFAADAGHGPNSATSHAPADAGVHAEVGLIGVADHAGPLHHVDGHL
jgi:hypothetical protein